jgi:hypothetical protein
MRKDPMGAEKLRGPVRGSDIQWVRAVWLHRAHIVDAISTHGGHRKEKPIVRMGPFRHELLPSGIGDGGLSCAIAAYRVEVYSRGVLQSAVIAEQCSRRTCHRPSRRTHTVVCR